MISCIPGDAPNELLATPPPKPDVDPKVGDEPNDGDVPNLGLPPKPPKYTKKNI